MLLAYCWLCCVGKHWQCPGTAGVPPRRDGRYQGIRCCCEHVTCKDFLSSFVEEVMLTEIFNKKCAGLAALYYSGDNRKAC
jgi:hypothetical protein